MYRYYRFSFPYALAREMAWQVFIRSDSRKFTYELVKDVLMSYCQNLADLAPNENNCYLFVDGTTQSITVVYFITD